MSELPPALRRVSGAHVEALVGHAGCGRSVGKAAVAAVAVEDVRAVAGDVQVCIAVVVVVCGYHTHAAPRIPRPGRLRPLGKTAMARVAVERRRGRNIDPIQVEPAVVIVKKGHARPHRLGQLLVVETKVHQHDITLARLETLIEQNDHRFDTVERQLDSLEKNTAARFDAVERQIDSLDRRMNGFLGLLFTSWLSTLGVILYKLL